MHPDHLFLRMAIMVEALPWDPEEGQGEMSGLEVLDQLRIAKYGMQRESCSN